MRLMQKFSIALVVLAAGLFFATASQTAPADKVTICHAAGLDGTTHFVEITISENAAFGKAGHFDENGTPNAGHEDDSIGPCDKKEPEPPKDDEPDDKAQAI